MNGCHKADALIKRLLRVPEKHKGKKAGIETWSTEASWDIQKSFIALQAGP